jgi:hypothetical protein
MMISFNNSISILFLFLITICSCKDIKLNFWALGGRLYKYPVDDTILIGDLKEKLSREFAGLDIPPDRMVLFIQGGEYLNDFRTVKYYEYLQDGETIFVDRKPQPQPPIRRRSQSPGRTYEEFCRPSVQPRPSESPPW